jgi:hypothetical protein
MSDIKSQGHKGQTVTGVMIAVATAFATVTWIWNAGLSKALYDNNSAISSLTASVADIKENTSNVPTLKAEVDWLVAQRGYVITPASSTTSYANNN